MTKREIIAALASRYGLGRSEARQVVDVLLERMVQGLEQGCRVEARGFGTLRARRYKAYAGRDPRTGAAIEVAAKVLPVFRPGRELLEIVSEREVER